MPPLTALDSSSFISPYLATVCSAAWLVANIVSCASCGAVLGSEKQRARASGRPQPCSNASDRGESSHSAECCSTDGAVGARELWREVSMLKRRVALRPFVSGKWGPNLLTRHSDLSAFTEELCSYSRSAAALRFLVLPFVPPRGVESPWEIGSQAPPDYSPEESAESSTLPGSPRAPAGAWVAVKKGAPSLELRILLRECFVAAGGTRDAGGHGHMAMKVG